MFIVSEELKTYRIVSRSGDIGRVADIVFPRGQWSVRYLIAWSEQLDRELSVPVSRVTETDRLGRMVLVDIDLNRAEASPRWDLTRRIEPHEEEQLHQYYGWPPYWLQEEQEVTPIEPLFRESDQMEPIDERESARPDLQLAGHVTGSFAVHASDKEFGVLQDVVLDSSTWTIPYLVVDCPSQKQSVIVATEYVGRWDWVTNDVYVTLSTEMLLESPRYKPRDLVTPELDRALHAYYDRLKGVK